MDKKDTARRILALSKLILAEDEPKTEDGPKPVLKDAGDRSELVQAAKHVRVLSDDFKKANKDLLAEMDKLEKEMKEKKELLSALFKNWENRTAYMKARKELLGQAMVCLTIGEKLAVLGDDITLEAKESKQPSYQQQLEILMSMLSEAETKKYKDLLANYFKKTIVKVETGVAKLDDDIKDWHQVAKDTAKERGFKLPTASRMPIAMNNLRMRDAGLWSTVKDTLSPLIPDFMKRVVRWAASLYNELLDSRDELMEINRQLDRLEKGIRENLS